MTPDMYFDDLLTVSNAFQAAEKLQDAFIKTLATANFDIGKWASIDSRLVSRPAAN